MWDLEVCHQLFCVVKNALLMQNMIVSLSIFNLYREPFGGNVSVQSVTSRVPSWETGLRSTGGLCAAPAFSLENKMCLQILIGVFEQVPMSQNPLALMGKR